MLVTSQRCFDGFIRVGLCLLMFVLMAVPTAMAAHPGEFSERLRHRLEVLRTPGELVAGGNVLYATAILRDFYDSRGYQPLWFDGERSTPALRALSEAIASAEAEGLNPYHYHLQTLDAVLVKLRSQAAGDRDARLLTDVELIASDAFLTLAKHYADGKVDPVTVDPGWFLSRGDTGLLALLEQAVDSESGPHKVLTALLPREPAYGALRDRLALQRQLDRNGDWEAIAPGPAIRRGDRGQRVEAVIRRLSLLGDLTETTASADSFDEDVDAAVRRFQVRHGLEADGIVGARTLAELNTTPEQRIDQLRLNMERWRWLPQSLGDEHILVNIAGFYMDVVAQGERVMRQRVIVGRPYRRTPVFSGNMTYLVLNPSWEVPHSLAVQDQLPQIRKDPTYLDRMGFAVLQGWGVQERPVDPGEVDWQRLSARNFPYRLRQRPGPQNALGEAKFMFPNRHNVYLHGTPARGLFAKDERAFSSGCIRVEEPRALAEWLLAGSGRPTVMNANRIRQVLEGGAETTVRLGRALPVHLLYWTSWVEGDGRVHYRRDIYGRDSVLLAALDQRLPGDQ